jgi:hypothetical protein
MTKSCGYDVVEGDGLEKDGSVWVDCMKNVSEVVIEILEF